MLIYILKFRAITPDRLKLIETEFNDKFRVSAVWVAVCLLSDFLELWKDLPSSLEIFVPILESLRKLPINRYNNLLKESVNALVTKLEQMSGNRKKCLVHEAKKPRPLRLYEPAIDDQYEFLQY